MSAPHGHTTQSADAPSYATTLELMNRFQEPEVWAILAELPLPAGSRGLDVGCGVGLYALWRADVIGAEGQVVAIDRSPERIADAVQRMQTAPEADRILVRQGDGTAIDEPDQSFDWVWCAQTSPTHPLLQCGINSALYPHWGNDSRRLRSKELHA